MVAVSEWILEGLAQELSQEFLEKTNYMYNAFVFFKNKSLFLSVSNLIFMKKKSFWTESVNPDKNVFVYIKSTFRVKFGFLFF